MIKPTALAALLFASAWPIEAGCRPPEPVIVSSIENAAAVAQYKALTDDCVKKGKAAKDFAVYEACADAVDAELCRTKSMRCPGGVK